MAAHHHQFSQIGKESPNLTSTRDKTREIERLTTFAHDLGNRAAETLEVIESHANRLLGAVPQADDARGDDISPDGEVERLSRALRRLDSLLGSIAIESARFNAL